MVYVSRLIRHPRPGFRFLQAPLNQACGAQINGLFIYRKGSVQKGFYPKKVLSKKGSIQKRFCPKNFCSKKVCDPRDRAYYDLTPEYREHARGDSPG